MLGEFSNVSRVPWGDPSQMPHLGPRVSGPHFSFPLITEESGRDWRRGSGRLVLRPGPSPHCREGAGRSGGRGVPAPTSRGGQTTSGLMSESGQGATERKGTGFTLSLVLALKQSLTWKHPIQRKVPPGRFAKHSTPGQTPSEVLPAQRFLSERARCSRRPAARLNSEASLSFGVFFIFNTFLSCTKDVVSSTETTKPPASIQAGWEKSKNKRTQLPPSQPGK